VSASWFLTVPLAVLLLVPAAAAASAGLRGRAGTLPADSKLGVHGPAAAVSPAASAMANRVAAPVVLAAAAVFVIGAILTLALRQPTGTTLVIFAVALIGGIALLIAGGSLGERAAATVPKPAAKPVGCDGCACGSGGCAGLTRSAPAQA
jgi:hypothetical protein